jgi:polyhydroxyalkanoate synthase subunit PhaE
MESSMVETSRTPHPVEGVTRNLLNAWIELYDKQYRRFLTVPQLGLTRYHQERTAEFLDKLNIAHARVAEFICCFFLPIQKSLEAMQLKFDELMKEGRLSDDPKDHYQMWIKMLENFYLSLFRSSDYLKTMGTTMDAVEQFAMAREKILKDILPGFSIPTLSDLDELAKDVYELKKEVKKLKRKAGQR